MIHVEYSFCKIRLPRTGLMLPWQLVAAQEPGPMYLPGSFSAARRKDGIRRTEQRISRLMEEMEEIDESRIRCADESVCLYRLHGWEVNAWR
jgi:hypothetical protein